MVIIEKVAVNFLQSVSLLKKTPTFAPKLRVYGKEFSYR